MLLGTIPPQNFLVVSWLSIFSLSKELNVVAAAAAVVFVVVVAITKLTDGINTESLRCCITGNEHGFTCIIAHVVAVSFRLLLLLFIEAKFVSDLN